VFLFDFAPYLFAAFAAVCVPFSTNSLREVGGRGVAGGGSFCREFGCTI